MKKEKSVRQARKISIRKHLPLAVRVHYDMVRNFSPAKLAGIGAMFFVGIFGVMLATQIIAPSQAFEEPVDTTSPKISISQSDNYFVATANEAVRENTWKRTIRQGGGCSRSNFPTDASRTVLNGSSFTVASSLVSTYIERSYRVCFKVQDLAGNWGYGSKRIDGTQLTSGDNIVDVVDTTKPRVAVVQNGNVVAATANEAVKTGTWESTIVTRDSDCGSGQFGPNDPIRDGDDFVVSSTKFEEYGGKYACFRVQDMSGNEGYGYEQLNEDEFVGPSAEVSPGSLEGSVDVTAPTVTVSQDGSRVSARANEAVKAGTWQYEVNNSSRCDSSTFSLSGNLESDGVDAAIASGSQNYFDVPANEASSYNNKYICFGVDDLTGNTGYGSRRITATTATTATTTTTTTPEETTRTPVVVKPTITVSSVGDNTYEATSNKTVKNWKYVIRNDNVCNGNVFSGVTATRSNRFQAADNAAVNKYNGKYICFTAQATDNNQWGHGYKQLVLTLDEADDDDNADGGTTTTSDEAGKQPDDTTKLADTGILGDDGGSWWQLVGYIVIASAIIGISRILIIKKHRSSGF